jgi:hypothetical protein
MAATTGQGPVLLMKKLGAMFSLVLGAVLTAFGYSIEYRRCRASGVGRNPLGAQNHKTQSGQSTRIALDRLEEGAAVPNARLRF